MVIPFDKKCVIPFVLHSYMWCVIYLYIMGFLVLCMLYILMLNVCNCLRNIPFGSCGGPYKGL